MLMYSEQERFKKGENMNTLILCLTMLSAIAQEPPKPNLTPEELDQMIFDETRSFAEIVSLATKKHYDISHFQDAMNNAKDAFLSTLDPHSSYLQPKVYSTMLKSTSGEPEAGIGVIIDNTRKSKDKSLTIVDTIPNGPSDKAGIKPQDKIIEIDGKQLEGLSTEEIITMLKGKPKTKVTIKVLRENHPDLISVDIIRDMLEDQNSLSFHIKDHDIYYVSLSMFSNNAVKKLLQFLQHSTTQPFRGLILDLRNNSGGLLTSAIDIAGLFMDKGSIVVTTKDKDGKVIEKYTTKRAPIANPKLPIIVLINNYTASAAEILAACLKNQAEAQAAKYPREQRGLVFFVGTPTFGKGSVQEVIPVSNNSAAKITTSLYFPENMEIQGKGITPDFIIERTMPLTEQVKWFTEHYGREHALKNSIRISKEEPTPEKKEEKKPSGWTERAKQMMQTDNQLREAINLINLIHNFRGLCPDKVCNRSAALEQLKNNHISQDKLTIEEIKF